MNYRPRTCRFAPPVGLMRALAFFLSLFLLLTTGCTTIRLTPPAADKPAKEAAPTSPAKNQLRVSQFLFLSDFELKSDLPLFEDLEHLREQVYKDLDLPPANTVIYVYLFQDRERYDRFMKAKYPDLPERRAFFVAQPRTVGGTDDLLVYTYWGERVQQDLRHELTHAMLHSVLKDVPLWLDEGLAENFEQPAEWKGVNYRHLEVLRRQNFKLEMTRLEQLNQVKDMKPSEYREAWGWVHWMLHSDETARDVLLGYLQQLRTNPNPGPLSARLVAEVPDLEGSVQRHLAKLDRSSPPSIKSN
jgi:hypothetical protein